MTNINKKITPDGELTVLDGFKVTMYSLVETCQETNATSATYSMNFEEKETGLTWKTTMTVELLEAQND